jgi:hypothetical protein
MRVWGVERVVVDALLEPQVSHAPVDCLARKWHRSVLLVPHDANNRVCHIVSWARLATNRDRQVADDPTLWGRLAKEAAVHTTGAMTYVTSPGLSRGAYTRPPHCVTP